MDSRSVGIVGVGLIGGSVALAALRSGFSVWLYDNIITDALSDARFRDACVASDLEEIASNSGMIILATPISALEHVIEKLAPYLRTGHIVSEVASVKREVVSLIQEAVAQRCDYIPVHPMAGSEKSGSAAARADLFSGAVTFLCSEFARNSENVQLVEDFWKALGTKVVPTTVGRHDELVAVMSHLPHLIATLLVTYAAENEPAALDFCGPGFRDLTRIASGAPDLWTEILLLNPALAEHLSRFNALIERTLPLLLQQDGKKLQALLDAAKQNRDRLTR